MKPILTSFLAILISATAVAQQFLWAESYDISNCNEVAAIDTDESGNIIITGVHNAGVYLPYHGPVYILKANAQGQPLWDEELNGDLQVGDMAAVGNDILIIGQATGSFNYRGESYGQGQYFMFVIMMDENGDVLWHFSEENKWGANTNIAVGNTENIALHIRGPGNLGDWIYIVDTDGNILQQKQIAAQFTMVMDIAYWNGEIYFNGGFNGPGTVMVDTILVQQPDFENASITMGFDENMTAKWLHTGQTINNQVGKIEASEHGLTVYEPLTDQFFNIENSLKKFSFDGELVNETLMPVFSQLNFVRPDLAVVSDKIGLFLQNSTNFNSHILFIYDHDLNLIDSKEVNGPSDLYAGQIAAYENDLLISHVLSGTLNFNDEITLEYSGGGKRPYIAKVGSLSIGVEENDQQQNPVHVFPNPATNFINLSFTGSELSLASLSIRNASGRIVWAGVTDKNHLRIDVSRWRAGMYVLNGLTTSGAAINQTFLKY